MRTIKLALSCMTLGLTIPMQATGSVEEAVSDSSRLEAHRVRDAGRQPAKVIKFAFPKIDEGAVVADIVAGSGYYSAILSRAVGNQGIVYAVNPIRIFQHFPQARVGFAEYLQKEPRPNIHYSEQFLDELVFGRPLDAALMVLYYHDTLWTGTDRTRMNQRIYQALKPGGRFLVVDHHAVSGAPLSVGSELHRMDAAIVRPEVEAVGFKFLRSSDLLENPGDTLDKSVFLPELRGKTHRFVYLFEKPSAG